MNGRSLSIEKAEELLSVASLNDVSCVCTTKTWFKEFMSDESVSLSGYCCERKDRVGRAGGGVACYVGATVAYDRLVDIEDDVDEVMWIRMRLHKLPRKFSSIVIACIYHPPNSDNSSMREYLIATLDGILRCHPDCGIILTGDFNQLRDMFLAHNMASHNLLTRPHAIVPSSISCGPIWILFTTRLSFSTR